MCDSAVSVGSIRMFNSNIATSISIGTKCDIQALKQISLNNMCDSAVSAGSIRMFNSNIATSISIGTKCDIQALKQISLELVHSRSFLYSTAPIRGSFGPYD